MISIANRRQGFTIIELMLVMVVLGVLATLAVPSMRDLLIATQVRAAASDLFESVILARSEAIKRAANIDVVPTGGNWGNGWTVMAGTTVIQTRDAATNVTITPTNTAGVVTYGNVTFRLDGRVSTGVRTLTVSTVQAAHPVAARCILIDASGRPSIKTDTDNDPSNGCN